MKPKKDIFDLFRDSGHKLTERPSRDAWNRLETRLDNHKRKNKRSFFRILAYAAAVLVLVVSVSLMTTLLQSPQNSMTADAATAYQTENLQVITVSEEHYEKIQDYQRTYKDHLSNPIAEGDAQKKLIPKIKVERRDGNLKTFLAKKQRENIQKPNVTEAVADNKKAETKVLKNTSEDEFMASAEATPLENQAELAMEHDPPVPLEAQAEAASYSIDAQDALPSEKVETMEDLTDSEEEKAISSGMTKDEIQDAFMRGESIGQAKARKKEQAANMATASDGLDQLQWLIGGWESTFNDEKVLQQWRSIEGKILLGSGFILADGKIVQVPTMQIQQISNEIYLITDPGDLNTETRFQLISNKPGKAIFVNKSGDAPKQITLVRGID